MARRSHGGWSPSKEATQEVQLITQLVQPVLEDQVSQCFRIFIALSYRSQVVADGTDYLIKVQYGFGVKDYAHLLVYVSYRREVVLWGYELDHTRSDPLILF